MIPKSEKARYVAKLRKRMPAFLTEEQEEWAKTLIGKEECFTNKQGNVCVMCGSDMGDSLKCPHCGCKHKAKNSNNRQWSRYYLVNILTHTEDYQAIRTFQVGFLFNRGIPVCIADNNLLCETYINEQGECFTFGCNKFMWTYNAGFSVELKKNTGDWLSNQNTWVYGKRTQGIAPFLKKRGLTVRIMNTVKTDPITFIQNILRNPQVETMLKAKEYDLLTHLISNYYGYRGYKYWNQICIARRHGYKIKNVGDWIDHIDLVRELGLDDHSPKYICPENFEEQHQQFIRRKNRMIEAKELEQRIKEIEKEEPAYAKRIEPYLGICIVSDNIEIRPLSSVAEFCKEGAVMHHCVFTNSYYKHKDSLVLSARIGEDRIETVEVSLNRFEIVQSRGVNNSTTKYHNAIMKAVRDNMDTIKAITERAVA